MALTLDEQQIVLELAAESLTAARPGLEASYAALPSTAGATERRRGALRGQIIMAPDFDVTPPEILTAMTGC
ncbi:hypothetical protein [Muricoccus aerilatus]|uniref:hypothetical protein n=1 Tax=Muricoccus aerilatus TaxID=452982 RepID=UPI000A883465|nr:hypothetical protein [Roseomonas aerilata]